MTGLGWPGASDRPGVLGIGWPTRDAREGAIGWVESPSHPRRPSTATWGASGDDEEGVRRGINAAGEPGDADSEASLPRDAAAGQGAGRSAAGQGAGRSAAGRAAAGRSAAGQVAGDHPAADFGDNTAGPASRLEHVPGDLPLQGESAGAGAGAGARPRGSDMSALVPASDAVGGSSVSRETHAPEPGEDATAVSSQPSDSPGATGLSAPVPVARSAGERPAIAPAAGASPRSGSPATAWARDPSGTAAAADPVDAASAVRATGIAGARAPGWPEPAASAPDVTAAAEAAAAVYAAGNPPLAAMSEEGASDAERGPSANAMPQAPSGAAAAAEPSSSVSRETGHDPALASQAEADPGGTAHGPPTATATTLVAAAPGRVQALDGSPAGPPAASLRPRLLGATGSMPRPAETRIITVANQKGGVGKTTTTVNLAAALALAGLEVLVLDLDPQGNASTALGVDHHADVPSVYDVLIDGRPLDEVVSRVEGFDALHCAPATVDLAGAEIELVPLVARESRLQRALTVYQRARAASGRRRLDYVFIDCPPSLGLLTVNALAAAAEVLVPIQCEYYALEGLEQLLRSVELIKAHLNPDLHVSTMLLTMYDGRTRLAAQVADEVRAHFPDLVLATTVPRSVRVSEAPSFRQTVMTYDPGSTGALSYLQAARELADRAAVVGQEGAS